MEKGTIVYFSQIALSETGILLEQKIYYTNHLAQYKKAYTILTLVAGAVVP